MGMRTAEMPPELIEKLGEFSYGGFIFFYFDAKGHPRCRMKFSEPADCIALQKFAKDYTEAIDETTKKSLQMQMLAVAEAEVLGGEEDDEDDVF